MDGFTLANGAISGATNLLPGGTYTVTAHYAGDPTFGGSDSSPVSITVGKENSSTQPELVTFDWNGNLISSNASTAVYGSPYLFRVNVLNSSGALCSPNPLGESSCPTGTVTLTDNSSPLDGGSFKLNSLGYTEDQLVQFPGGSNAIKASYPGDNSFIASSANATYSITLAPTTMSSLTLCCTGTAQGTVGQPFSANVTVQAQSFGAAPTGTVTFLANGTPVSGTVSYQPTAGTVSNPTATLYAYFTSSSSAFATVGNYTITASYSGDQDYSSSVSAGSTLTVKYPAPSLSLTPTSLTVAGGSSVTLNAIVDTSLKNVPVPSSPVNFYYFNALGTPPLTGNETYSSTTDASGNVALQAQMTFVPTVNTSVIVIYNGDQNYPQAVSSGSSAQITVTGSDFGVFPQLSSITVDSPGGQTGMQLYVLGQSNYAGTINFSPGSCSGLPNESTCSFSPASVTGVGSTSVTVNTTGPHPLATNRKSPAEDLWATALGTPLAAFLLIALPRRRTWRSLGPLLLVAMFCVCLSCGGGNGGGGGGTRTDPGTPPGSYTITVTATSGSGSTAITHTTTFTLVVQ